MDKYDQPEKADARRRPWQHAVEALTTRRSDVRVLQEDYIRQLWGFAFDERLSLIGKSALRDDGVLSDWCDYARDRYGVMAPNQLKVAYLSGPEPDNDVGVLTQMGVLPENIWAFEADPATRTAAQRRLKETFPTVKRK